MAKKLAWNLSELFSSDTDPAITQEQAQLRKQAEGFVKKWKDREFTQDAQTLLEALKDFESWVTNWGSSGKQGFYFQLRSAQDQNDKTLKALAEKAKEISRNISAQTAFFLLELAKTPHAQQAEFLADERFAPYKHFLERVFDTAKFDLSEPEEKMVALLSGLAKRDWEEMVEDFLSKETVVLSAGKKKIRVGFNKLLTYMSNPDKKLRDSAAKAFNEILERNKPAAEWEINAIMRYRKTMDQLRGYSRPDQARHVGDDIETEVVDALRAAVRNRFDISARFYRLKAQLMGMSKLAYHERNLQVGSLSSVKLSWEEALDLVRKVFRGLGPEFETILEEFVKGGRLDVFPQKGKYSGAFCASRRRHDPVFVLLNFGGRVSDVMTLAHEMGHAINFEMMREQNELNYDVSTAVTEVASTFMENFVLDEIRKSANEETRLALLMEQLNDAVSSIFRQIACYEFEWDLHQELRQTPFLSSQIIGRLFQKNMRAYMGGAVEQPIESKNWWVYWSHIRNYFYVYSYASGLLVSYGLQKKIRGNPQTINGLKRFLTAGTSCSPRETFLPLGIDIARKEFWEEGLEEIDGLLKEAQQLAKKLGKI